MKKRFICVLLTVVIVFCLSACEDGDIKDLADKTFYVAVVADSDETTVARLYCDTIGAELSEYNSSHDAVVAVQNGKADFVVLNEYEAQSFIDADSGLVFLENCEQKLEYRAFFNPEDDELCRQFNEALLYLSQNGTLRNIKQAQIKGEDYIPPELSDPKGDLLMLCDPIFENRVYYDEANNLKGTDVGIAKAVCSYLGYNLIIEVADFDLMFTELEKGNADFIMSAAEFTGARAENFLLSDVYSTLEYGVYISNT